MEQFTAKGYVLYNTLIEEYLDPKDYTTTDINKALCVENLEEIQEDLNEIDYPEEWVIKKLDILFTVLDLEEEDI